VRIFAPVVVICLLLLVTTPILNARPKRPVPRPASKKITRHIKKHKPQIIKARITFHNAKPNRKTTFSKRQTAKMAALNRSKKHHLMNKGIEPYAYEDKKTGKIIYAKLSSRTIEDVMGYRTDPNYRIDYYIAGPMPASYDKYNKAIWYFRVIN